MHLDLRDFFGFSAPGFYELTVEFSAPFPATGTSSVMYFILPRPEVAP